MAIQSRLNPHFPFNSLNAARNLIEKAKQSDAQDYILQLSVYLRHVLKVHTSNFHSLADELELSKAYMDIVTIRLGKQLSFEIHCPATIPTEDIMFPPLGIQPLLENAVWHGNIEQRKVMLTVKERHAEGWQLDICDNIGGLDSTAYQKALEANSSKTGLKLFKNKIDLFNKSSAFLIDWSTNLNEMDGTCFSLNIEHKQKE
ncbi:sensor histidine kinase [Lacihabitans sp. LS3-19]|uniref:sensor histidine kinase n=1 Tax=Lacihabitans sp. LS3-19 TaxID=2487335 RepID=UPI0020CB8CA8|nr:histidine kinase [Lacihabitans sp. LS3-19]